MERNAAGVHKSLKEQPDMCINILNCSSNKSIDNDIYFFVLVGKQLIVYMSWGWVMYQYWLSFDTFCPLRGENWRPLFRASVETKQTSKSAADSSPAPRCLSHRENRLNLTDFCLDFWGQLTITVGNDISLMMSADQRTPGLGRDDRSLPACSL